jgi:hypothetical protein
MSAPIDAFWPLSLHDSRSVFFCCCCVVPKKVSCACLQDIISCKLLDIQYTSPFSLDLETSTFLFCISLRKHFERNHAWHNDAVKFDSIHPIVYREMQKQHYIFHPTQPLFIISSNTMFQSGQSLSGVYFIQRLKTEGKNVNFSEISIVIHILHHLCELAKIYIVYLF